MGQDVTHHVSGTIGDVRKHNVSLRKRECSPFCVNRSHSQNLSLVFVRKIVGEVSANLSKKTTDASVKQELFFKDGWKNRISLKRSDRSLTKGR